MIIPYRKGQVIGEPGIYSGVPLSVYHGAGLCDGPSISSSGLRTIFNDSPAHYFATSPYNPDREEPDETAAFTLGRAAHHLLLGEDDFSTLFIMRPEELAGKPWQGNRTDCKAWLKTQKAAGRTVLAPEQVNTIRRMAKSLAAHPLVQAGVLNGHIEQTMVWRDKETGIWLKARPDAIPNDSGDYADLKTTSDFGFKLDRSIGTYRYDIQAALVGRGSRATLGVEMTSFSFVFVEKTVPYTVDVLTLQHQDLEHADQDLQVALRVFARCMETGSWFGPSGTQSDARFAHLSDFFRDAADARRAFLLQEIIQSQMERDRGPSTD